MGQREGRVVVGIGERAIEFIDIEGVDNTISGIVDYVSIFEGFSLHEFIIFSQILQVIFETSVAASERSKASVSSSEAVSAKYAFRVLHTVNIEASAEPHLQLM